MAKNQRARLPAGATSSETSVNRRLRVVEGGGIAVDRGRRSGIDALRGFAVALMVVFHALFDLHFFCAERLQNRLHLPPWFLVYVPDFIGSTFLGVVGISSWLAWTGQGRAVGLRPLFRRFLKLAFFSGVITGATLVFAPSSAIYFGVLHCIALSTLLAYPLTRLPFGWNLALGTGVLLAGAWVEPIELSSRAWMWLGLKGPGFVGQDFYPLVPWFGPVAIGLGWAQACEPTLSPPRGVRWGLQGLAHGGSRLWNSVMAGSRVGTALVFLGKNALWIYLLHQPVLLGILKAVGWADLG